jgi:hypothetical protein
MRAGTAVLAGLLALAPSVYAGFTTEPTHPTQGMATRIFLTDADGAPLGGVPVVVRYRPGSRVESADTLGTTDPAGALEWMPRDAGLVTLATAGEDGPSISSNLSVRYKGVPLPGLVIMILAGLILYGGVIRGFRAMKEPIPLPPDT